MYNESARSTRRLSIDGEGGSRDFDELKKVLFSGFNLLIIILNKNIYIDFDKKYIYYSSILNSFK